MAFFGITSTFQFRTKVHKVKRQSHSPLRHL